MGLRYYIEVQRDDTQYQGNRPPAWDKSADERGDVLLGGRRRRIEMRIVPPLLRDPRQEDRILRHANQVERMARTTGREIRDRRKRCWRRGIRRPTGRTRNTGPDVREGRALSRGRGFTAFYHDEDVVRLAIVVSDEDGQRTYGAARSALHT